MNLRTIGSAALAAMMAAASALAQQPVVLGEPSKTPPKALVAPQLRLANENAVRVELPAVSDGELAMVRQANRRSADAFKPSAPRRVAIGVLRDGEVKSPSGAQLQWRA